MDAPHYARHDLPAVQEPPVAGAAEGEAVSWNVLRAELDDLQGTFGLYCMILQGAGPGRVTLEMGDCPAKTHASMAEAHAYVAGWKDAMLYRDRLAAETPKPPEPTP